MSASQIILLDRAIGKLGVLRCMEEHAKERGIMFASDLLPCLRKSYLAYANSLRRDLEALKDLGMDQIERVPTIQQIIAEFDAAKENDNAKKSAGDSRKQ